MKTEVLVEIITIGREILDGRVIDTNSVTIAEVLRPYGFTPRFGQRVDDRIDRITEAFEIAARRSNLILVTGGLGPTSDDLSAEAFAKFMGEALVLNSDALRQVEAVFAKFGRSMHDVQRKQAMLPPSCFILSNPVGTAPGFGIERGGRYWFFMPGVPQEMKAMLSEQIMPRVKHLAPERPCSMTWGTQFTSEGKLQTQLTGIEKRLPPHFEMTYRTRFPENHIALYANCVDANEKTLFENLCAEVSAVLGSDVFATSRDSNPLPSLEEVVVSQLQTRHTMLATVESCTGGLIANRITNVSGSSAVFWGSVIAYDNSAKTNIVGLAQSILDQHGAVSHETAKRLAENGLKKMQDSLNKQQPLICISTTGIAGPSGGSKEKPVGLCYIGVARSDGPTHVEELRARTGLDRQQNKLLFAQKALDLARLLILR